MLNGSLVVFSKGFIPLGTVGPGIVPIQNRGMKNRIRYAGLFFKHSELEYVIDHCNPISFLSQELCFFFIFIDTTSLNFFFGLSSCILGRLLEN